MAQEFVEYKGQKDFDKDRRKREKNGWRVANVGTVPQASGVKRIIALGGIGAMLIKPKPQIYVTYEK